MSVMGPISAGPLTPVSRTMMPLARRLGERIFRPAEFLSIRDWAEMPLVTDLREN